MSDKELGIIRLKGSSNMVVAVLLVLVLCVLITLLSNRHFLTWDLTGTGEHTLSEKTHQVLTTIREPVLIKAFVQEGQGSSKQVKRLLSSYRDRSPQITFELVDPDRNPALAERYNVKALDTLVLEGYRSTQIAKVPNEEGITNALIRLSRRETLKIYFLTGHGERTFQGSEQESLGMLREDLSKENFQSHELSLMKTDVPADASLVIAAAPRKPLFPEEILSLGKYLKGGGSLVLFLEPFEDAGLTGFLKDNGVLTAQDIIVDKMSRVLGGDYLVPIVANYGAHEITRDFRLPCFFPLARSVETAGEKRNEVKTTALAFTSNNSWAETDRETLNAGKAGFDERDRQGPISLAVIAERLPSEEKAEGAEGIGKQAPAGTSGTGRLVVFGDVDFVSNKFLGLSGNRDLINNTVNYLVGRRDLITIQRERKPAQRLMLTQNQGQVLFWVPVVLIPLCVLILGVGVWHRRRSR